MQQQRTALKWALNIVFVLAILIQTTVPAWGADIDIRGETAVLIDQYTGRILFEKDANKKWDPASTTKILTALIALEQGKLSDVVTVSKRATEAEGTQVWLVEGEQHTLEDLIYAMMLNSANDAAVAVAEHIGGSVEGFARLMNEKVEQLGLKGSHFSNPHGLTASDHYSTAYDMAVIAREAMKIPKFREIVITQTRPWRGEDWDSKLRNINMLLNYYPGATGVKTGYTTESAYCIVASASRNGKNFIAVVLGSDKNSLWKDAQKLLDYGFNNFEHVSLVKKGEEIATVNMQGSGVAEDLKLITREDFSYLVGGEETILPERKLYMKNIGLPVEQGSNLGYISFMLEGKEVGQVPVIAGQSIEEPITWLDWWYWFSWLLVGLLLLRFFIRSLIKRRKRRRIYAGHKRRYTTRAQRF